MTRHYYGLHALHLFNLFIAIFFLYINKYYSFLSSKWLLIPKKSARNELLQKFVVVNIQNVADKGKILQNLLDRNSDDVKKHISYANIVRNKFKYLDETLYSKLVKKVLSHTLSSNLKRTLHRRADIFGILFDTQNMHQPVDEIYQQLNYDNNT